MIRISSLLGIKRSALLVSVVALASVVPVVLAACADVSPAIGKYYTGRTLHLNVVAIERTPELIYKPEGAAPDSAYYRLAPSEPDLELVMLRIKVENHRATSAIVNIDERAAELRDFLQGKYFPIDVAERVEEVPPSANLNETHISRCPIEHPRDLCFLWNPLLEDGSRRAFDLSNGSGIDGWMIFEAPQDAEIRELRWRAGDGITIGF